MKRYVRSSFLDDDEEFDDIDTWDYSREEVVPAIMKALVVKKPIADIIYEWYDAEDAWEDHESLEDFISYLKDDIYDMADACDDEALRDKVLVALAGK